MSGHGRLGDRVTDEAALWFVRAQDPDFPDEDRKALASWLAGSAEHVREYLSVAAVTQDIHSLSATPSVDELIALAQNASDAGNVVALLGVRQATESRANGLPPRREGDDWPNLPTSRARGLDQKRSHRDLEPGVRHVSWRRARAGGGFLQPAGRTRPPRWRRSWAAAAAVVVGLGFAGLLYFASRPVVYSTGVGEHLSFPLEDGSIVTLNAQSSLELAYTDDARSVVLVEGEALFNVAKDPARPFQVYTGRAVIRAVGTQFNVRSRGERATVTVVEGIVDVAAVEAIRTRTEVAPLADTHRSPSPPVVEPVRLVAGQQATVPSRSGEISVVQIKVDKATSWRERRLVFEAWTLEDVVQEFNLYNEQRIVIEDPTLAQQSISGVFSADDRLSFTLFLDEAGLAVAKTRADGTIELHAKSSSP